MNTEIRQLPFNQEAEQSALGCILNDPESIYTALSILEPADFYSITHAGIFQAMQDLSKKDTAIDILSLADEIRRKDRLQEIGGLDFLSSLEDMIPTSQAITHYCQIVKQNSALRRLIKAGYKLEQEAYGAKEEAETLIESAQNEIYSIALDLQNKSRKKQVYGPEEIAKMAAKSAGEAVENPNKARGIETGYVQLDGAIRGLKDVNIISASTGVGKTTLALNLAVRIGIHQEIPTLYLNHEMNLEELHIRLQGILSGVPLENIQRGNYSDKYPFQRVMDASTKIAEGSLYLTDNEPKTLNTVINLIQKHKAQHCIKVVILDYLGEIEPSKEELRESEYLVYGQWVQRLKGVCTSLGIKLILLAQLNREGDKEVSKNKIGGSWKIVQKSDVFLIMGVDKKGRYFLRVDKNRNGPAPKTIHLDFNKDTQRIAEAELGEISK